MPCRAQCEQNAYPMSEMNLNQIDNQPIPYLGHHLCQDVFLQPPDHDRGFQNHIQLLQIATSRVIPALRAFECGAISKSESSELKNVVIDRNTSNQNRENF